MPAKLSQPTLTPVLPIAVAVPVPAPLRAFPLEAQRWQWTFRTLLAAEMIALAPEYPLAAVMSACAFRSQAHFSRRFRALFREPPRRFQAHFRELDAAGKLPVSTLPKWSTLAELGRVATPLVMAKLHHRGLQC